DEKESDRPGSQHHQGPRAVGDRRRADDRGAGLLRAYSRPRGRRGSPPSDDQGPGVGEDRRAAGAPSRLSCPCQMVCMPPDLKCAVSDYLFLKPFARRASITDLRMKVLPIDLDTCLWE